MIKLWNPFTRKRDICAQVRARKEAEEQKDQELVERELLAPPIPGPYRVAKYYRLFGTCGLMLAIIDMTPAQRVIAFMRPADATRFVERYNSQTTGQPVEPER